MSNSCFFIMQPVFRSLALRRASAQLSFTVIWMRFLLYLSLSVNFSAFHQKHQFHHFIFEYFEQCAI